MTHQEFNKKYNKKSLNTTNLIHSYYTTFIKNIKVRSKITSKLIDNRETGSISISPFNSMSPDDDAPAASSSRRRRSPVWPADDSAHLELFGDALRRAWQERFAAASHEAQATAAQAQAEQAQAASADQSRRPSSIRSAAFRRAPVSAFQDTASQRGMPSAWDWEHFDEEVDLRRGGRKKKKNRQKNLKFYKRN
mgnify:CR=1 FL=1